MKIKPNFKKTSKGIVFECKNYYWEIKELLFLVIQLNERIKTINTNANEIVFDVILLEIYKKHFSDDEIKQRITLNFSQAIALSYVLLGTNLSFLGFEIHKLLNL